MDATTTQGAYNVEDAEFAMDIGERFADRLFIVASKFWSVSRHQQSKLLLDQLLVEVGKYDEDRHERPAIALNADERRRYSQAIARVARVMNASRRFGLGGVPTLLQRAGAASEDPRHGVIVIDVFNRLALQGIFTAAESADAGRIESPPIVGLPGWGRTLGGLLRSLGYVRFVPEREASRGVLSLFADQLRFVLGGRREPGPSHVQFTLHNRDEAAGYQIRHFEEFNYSPVVFGRTLSSPVTGPLSPGLYKFEGRRDSRTFTDTGRYAVDVDHAEATLGDF